MVGALHQFTPMSRCLAVATIVMLAMPAVGYGQRIRTKKPDRGVYQPPLTEVTVEDQQSASSEQHGMQVSSEPLRLQAAPQPSAERSRGGPLVDTAIGPANNSPQRVQRSTRRQVQATPASAPVQSTAGPTAGRNKTRVTRQTTQRRAPLQNVGFNDAVPMPPSLNASGEVIISDNVISETVLPNSGHYVDTVPLDSGSCDACGCDACGPSGNGCDSMGCDSACGLSMLSPNSRISFDPSRWFGSAELLLMFRRGDRPPALVTTGSDANDDTAGELGQADTQILVGGDSIFKDVTAGGRLQLGTWLDDQQSRSLVFRGWFAGEESFGFARSQDTLPVIARPFLNASGNQPEAQDTQLVVFPDRASGSLSIQGDSNVYGADVSVRQLWYGQHGIEVDFLYGYQFLRLDENLTISTSSVSLDDDFAPLGSTLAIRDQFDIENEFHGGQVGLASRARHGCWSFQSLTKVAFGSLGRTADLQGATTTGIDGTVATSSEGLLVRDTNSGKRTDHTFGWVPEIDLTVGWHRFPQWEVTFGYHVTAVSDALQVSGAIDPNLAVNLTDPLVGREAPSNAFRYDTFYVQGLHFGLEYVH